MDIDLKPFTEKMIARVTALLGECAIELSRVIEPSFATLSETTLHAGAGEAGAVAGLGAQTLRSRIERVLAEDAPRLQRMANEAARLAAAVRARESARSRARSGVQQDEAPGEVG